MVKGKVTYYKNEHGFGYAETIINNDTEKIYLHFLEMESLEVSNNLKLGDIIEFEITENLRNGLCACNIKLIK